MAGNCNIRARFRCMAQCGVLGVLGYKEGQRTNWGFGRIAMGERRCPGTLYIRNRQLAKEAGQGGWGVGDKLTDVDFSKHGIV